MSYRTAIPQEPWRRWWFGRLCAQFAWQPRFGPVQFRIIGQRSP